MHWLTRVADNPGMFTRSNRTWIAWIALLAVIFAALTSAAPAAAGAPTNVDDLLLGSICTSHSQAEPAVPGQSGTGHSHCGLCVLGQSLILASPAELALATVSVPAVLPRASRNHLLPRDSVAVHPLIPRAPPRAL